MFQAEVLYILRAYRRKVAELMPYPRRHRSRVGHVFAGFDFDNIKVPKAPVSGTVPLSTVRVGILATFFRNMASRDANQLQLQCLTGFLVRTQRCVTIHLDIAIKSRTNRKFAS